MSLNRGPSCTAVHGPFLVDQPQCEPCSHMLLRGALLPGWSWNVEDLSGTSCVCMYVCVLHPKRPKERSPAPTGELLPPLIAAFPDLFELRIVVHFQFSVLATFLNPPCPVRFAHNERMAIGRRTFIRECFQTVFYRNELRTYHTDLRAHAEKI